MIFTENQASYNQLLKYMKTQAEAADDSKHSYFHTYIPQISKTHGFVIRRLDYHPSPDEVQEHDIETVAVYEMKATVRPRYLIIASSVITLKQLQQSIKYVMAVSVTFEHRYNKKRLIPYHRCQS